MPFSRVVIIISSPSRNFLFRFSSYAFVGIDVTGNVCVGKFVGYKYGVLDGTGDLIMTGAEMDDAVGCLVGASVFGFVKF